MTAPLSTRARHPAVPAHYSPWHHAVATPYPDRRSETMLRRPDVDEVMEYGRVLGFDLTPLEARMIQARMMDTIAAPRAVDQLRGAARRRRGAAGGPRRARAGGRGGGGGGAGGRRSASPTATRADGPPTRRIRSAASSPAAGWPAPRAGRAAARRGGPGAT